MPPVTDREGQTQTRERVRVEPPRRYKVLLHNDDYTTMEFVVYVLMNHFNRSRPEALNIMLQVHKNGLGVAGVYSRDVAETKADRVTREAREAGMPLVLSTEPE
jgi:ATP-dependent Clp protease adaptor protein ClpS